MVIIMTTQKTAQLVNVEYKASVHTPAGHRAVYMKGTAHKISEKRVVIVEITHIDDESVQYNMSRTGANRQKFNGVYFAGQEVGKTKNISTLFAISE
jgi:hypothetical protein